MNKKKSLLFSIILVLVIGLVVTGSTFAYLQWTLNSSDGTSVNVTIEMGGITMHIESDDQEFVGLYPTKIDDASDCARARYGDALVTIVNNTGTMAVPSFKLKVKVTKGGSDALTKNALSHIRYSVVPVTTTVDGSGKPVKGTEVSSCYAGVTGGSADGNKYDVETSWTTAGFKFESVSTSGEWTHIPVANDYVNGGDNKINTGYLPRQYNTTTETVSGITFKAPQYATTYQYFRVYVWLDEGYTTTTIGNVVSDPLQNAKIEIMWSEDSMVEQVTGSGTAAEYPNAVPNGSEAELAPGIYDEDGQLVSTWDQLVSSNTIYVDDTTITGINFFEFQSVHTLVIPDEITIIGSNAFEGGTLEEIKFGKNSKLTTIGENAFFETLLQKIEIPASVTTIESGAFGRCNLSLTFAPNSKLKRIEEWTFSQGGLISIEIPESVEYIGAYAFAEELLESISYKGTVEQWNEIEKEDYWYGDMYGHASAPYVECSNGKIDISYDFGGENGDEVYYSAGLYYGDGTFISWDTLVDRGDISYSGTLLTNVYGNFSDAVLVIPSYIEKIGYSAFRASFNEVRFESGSQLGEILQYAFTGAIINKLVLPTSLYVFADYSFSDASIDNLYYEGTISEWVMVERVASNWCEGMTATIVNCSDGTTTIG